MSEIASSPTFYEQLRVVTDKRIASCVAAVALSLTACGNAESTPATVSVEDMQSTDHSLAELSEPAIEDNEASSLQDQECIALAAELVIGTGEEDGTYIPPIDAKEPTEADLSAECSEDRVNVEVDTGLGYSLPLSYELQDQEWVAVNPSGL